MKRPYLSRRVLVGLVGLHRKAKILKLSEEELLALDWVERVLVYRGWSRKGGER